MSRPFHEGEALVIAPQDSDDPMALACAGVVCKFVRYNHAGHACVTLDDGRKRFFLRATDLQRVEEVKK